MLSAFVRAVRHTERRRLARHAPLDQVVQAKRCLLHRRRIAAAGTDRQAAHALVHFDPLQLAAVARVEHHEEVLGAHRLGGHQPIGRGESQGRKVLVLGR